MWLFDVNKKYRHILILDGGNLERNLHFIYALLEQPGAAN